ncbi:uncharacterized protein FA14DRAFT_69609 [Meira miltonrushii]|uniref:Uncharacterized protein n=1 Tax=Meira miltonrushii TaxID=1280837 RepID=A0A316V9J8_9BASI|nr:uncharacterized protein FA14DRAFT_69609 [Meira miltonrushii]PWN34166.1 hypothetical protein FA14DRAFT_69609 [Meira miltonrushii]
MDRKTVPNGSQCCFGDVFPINANALILDLASQSVKLRRRRGNSIDEGDAKDKAEFLQLTPAHVHSRAPFPSPSRRLFDRHLPLLQPRKIFKSTAPLKITKMSTSQQFGEDIELIQSGRQCSNMTATHPENNIRRKRNKALGHALRKSRDLRNAKELAEMLGRPLPPLPPVDPTENMAKVLADSPLELPEPPCRPKRSPARLAAALPPIDQKPATSKKANDDDDDWASFISRGYALFPQPPSTRPIVSKSNRSRLAHKQAKRLSGLSRFDTDSCSPQSSMDSVMMRRSKTVPQKTGIDWLDDELAWVSSDDEREELCRAMTPSEGPISAFTAGLGLTRSASTPPSSSVDTFPGSDSSISIFQTPSQQMQQQKNKWRLSGVSDVFVTPTASPQIDLGTLTMSGKDGKTLSSIKRAHLPMFAGLADAVSRYAAEAAGFERNIDEEREEEEEAHDDFAAIANRHDSVSSITSSSAMSRDFSSATTISTRPSSIAGISECGSSASWARSPTSQARMRQLPPSTSSRVGSVDGSMIGQDFSFPSTSTMDKLTHSSSNKHHRKPSDASSSHSKAPRRRRGSKVPWPQEGSIPPLAPVRIASLQTAQSQPASSPERSERQLMGSWLDQGEQFEPTPVAQSNASSSTVVFDLSSTSTINQHRNALASRSTVDLMQPSSPAPPVAKSGLRGLFARQRRQSTSNVLDNKSQQSLVPSVKSADSTGSIDRTRPPAQLADRILSKMGGGSAFNALDVARPLADVPVTPTTTSDEPAPQSSPSQKIFGSASLAPHPMPYGLRQSLDQDRMTAADGLRAFAEASSASRRTSTISTKAMPTQLAGHYTNSRGNSSSVSRAASLRSRVRGLVFDYDPASPFYVYDGDEQIPVNTVKTPTSARQKSAGAPPVTFWRRGGARALSACDSYDDGESDRRTSLDQSYDSINTINSVQRTAAPAQQQSVRRKSSFNLWK